MNKAQLIDAASAAAGLPKTVTNKALDAILDSITSALSTGDQVTFVGFGTFGVKIRAARTGRNPQTGEALEIGEAKVPYFKAGKSLKVAVENAVVEDIVE